MIERCYAFVGSELVTPQGTKLVAGNIYDWTPRELGLYRSPYDAVYAASGTYLVCMEVLECPSHNSIGLVGEGSVTQMLWSAPGYREIHYIAKISVEDQLDKWRRSDLYNPEVNDILWRSMLAKDKYMQDNTGSDEVASWVTALWNTMLTEQRALKPGRSKTKTSETVQLLIRAARACSTNWMQARYAWDSSIRLHIESRLRDLEWSTSENS